MCTCHLTNLHIQKEHYNGKWNEKWEHTPEGWEEMVNADWGAQCIWERTDPLMPKRVSTGSDPTARI